MSQVKVDSIYTRDGNTDLLTVSNGVGSGVVFGRRNLIINGAMQMAQRSTSLSGRTTLNAYATVDRFFGNSSSVGSFECTDEQSTDAPNGFSFSRKLLFSQIDLLAFLTLRKYLKVGFLILLCP